MQKILLEEIYRINELMGVKKPINEAITTGGEPLITLLKDLLQSGETAAAKKLEQQMQMKLRKLESEAITDVERMEIQQLSRELDDLMTSKTIARQTANEIEQKLAGLVTAETFASELLSSKMLGTGLDDAITKAKNAIQTGKLSSSTALDKMSQVLDQSNYIKNNPTLKQALLNDIEQELKKVRPVSGPGSLVQVTAAEASQIAGQLENEFPVLFKQGRFGIGYKYPDAVTKATSTVQNTFAGKTEDELKKYIRKTYDDIENSVKNLPQNDPLRKEWNGVKTANNVQQSIKSGRKIVYQTIVGAFVLATGYYLISKLIKNDGNVAKTAGEVTSETVIDLGKGLAKPIKNELEPDDNKTKTPDDKTPDDKTKGRTLGPDDY